MFKDAVRYIDGLGVKLHTACSFGTAVCKGAAGNVRPGSSVTIHPVEHSAGLIAAVAVFKDTICKIQCGSEEMNRTAADPAAALQRGITIRKTAFCRSKLGICFTECAIIPVINIQCAAVLGEYIDKINGIKHDFKEFHTNRTASTVTTHTLTINDQIS